MNLVRSSTSSGIPSSYGEVTLPQTFDTAHSNSDYRTIRIIRPHHPLFGKSVPLVKIWEHKNKRYYVIELPDKSHTRIPLHWADQGKIPLPQSPSGGPAFTVEAVRELFSLMSTLANKASKTEAKGLSFPYGLPKEDEYGKAAGPIQVGARK
jgi:hypothetical protein